jgi:hypothetical protein
MRKIAATHPSLTAHQQVRRVVCAELRDFHRFFAANTCHPLRYNASHVDRSAFRTLGALCRTVGGFVAVPLAPRTVVV